LPSLSENFGNVVVEAMIRNVPVVVSDSVGAADIVKASRGGIVVTSGEGLAVALSDILKSDERLAALGLAGGQYVREQLTWRVIAQRFVKLYEEVSWKIGDCGQRRKLVATST
jgi:glycosyltransferase involved in cell wall biosynthesis